MAKLIREISAVGLSSREGCGNTVRNVTADPLAGICEGEVFDPTPYVGAYVRYFVRHPTTQLMPRKVKTVVRRHATATARSAASTTSPSTRASATASRASRSASAAARRSCRASRRRSGTSRRADDGEYMKIAEAVFRIFDRQDWLRVNRARARVKVLVDKIGADEMRKLVEEELQGRLGRRARLHARPLHPRRGSRRARPSRRASRAPTATAAEFDRFVLGNVVPQKQEGFSAVTVKITRGDLTPEQFRGLGQIMRDFTGGYARTTVQQNLTLRWVRDEALYDVWQRLVELGLGDAGADEITDVVSCPGTDSCKLGITSSMGLNKAVKERVDVAGDRGPARQAHPHQDERLPERLQPAPHREHRVLRRVDQGRRAHDPGLRRAHRRPVRGRRGRDTARA